MTVKSERPPQLVIVLNGHPGAGKDTAAAYMSTHFEILGWETLQLSSIDSVRNMLAQYGVPVHLKGNAERDLLESVGDALERYNSFRTAQVIRDVDEFLLMNRNDASVAFVHMREPQLIAKLRDHFEGSGVAVKTVCIERDSQAICTNTADTGVDEMQYDYTISNSGSYAELAASSVLLADCLAPTHTKLFRAADKYAARNL